MTRRTVARVVSQQNVSSLLVWFGVGRGWQSETNGFESLMNKLFLYFLPAVVAPPIMCGIFLGGFDWGVGVVGLGGKESKAWGFAVTAVCLASSLKIF